MPLFPVLALVVGDAVVVCGGGGGVVCVEEVEVGVLELELGLDALTQ